jgi:hypothetical protein
MALKLWGEVGLDGSGFERGLARLGATAASNLKNFVIGAFGIYGVQQAIMKTVESADELVVASKRLDMTVEQLQVMRQAAMRTRTDFAYLEKAFEGFNIAKEKALSGGKEGAGFMAAFGRLGMTKEMLQSQTSATAFMGQLHQTALSANSADLDASLRKILPGFRNFGEILPFLKTDFAALEKEMSSMGAIMSGTTANELKVFKDEMGLVGTIITTQLAPWLVKLGEAAYWLMEKFQGAGAFYGTLLADWAHGIFRGSGQDAATERDKVTGVMDAAWAAFQKRIADLTNAAKNPIPPNAIEEKEGKAAKLKAFHEKSGDSLVSVGNFLGTSRGGISGLQERLVRHTEQTAKNTSAMLIELRKRNPGHSVTGSAFGLPGTTIWPST